jgi:HSP20 family protein
MARSLSIIPTPGTGAWGAGPFLLLHREMNRLFDEVARGGPLAAGDAAKEAAVLIPRMDVTETDSEVRITAELPGVNQEDIELSINDDLLTLRAEKAQERTEAEGDRQLVERAVGVFQRTLRLPFAVDPDAVQASAENGVLTITLPKANAQQRARRIAVQGKPAGGNGKGAKDDRSAGATQTSGESPSFAETPPSQAASSPAGGASASGSPSA